MIQFNDVTFKYPDDPSDLDKAGNPIINKPVFEHFTGTIPSSFTSLVGPNGCGKTTFMMLASGRLIPQNGNVKLFDQNIGALGEQQKNLVASVIYQNMEFETQQPANELLSYVYKNGNFRGNAKGIEERDLLAEVTEVFELGNLLSRPLQKLSKGEIQRTLLAFSLLYGSMSIFMDEPLFAMEFKQKENSLNYLKKFSNETGTPMYISIHELELSKKYADNVLLFYPNRDMIFGSPEEVLTKDDLEKAYGVPYGMLKDQEEMNRQTFSEINKNFGQQTPLD